MIPHICSYIDTVEDLQFRCSMAMLAGAVLCLRHTLAFGQLALLVTTIGNAFEQLAHFLVVFMLFLFTFGTVAWVMYGSELTQFHSILASMQTCFNILVGAGDNFDAMDGVDSLSTSIFWNLFMLTGAVIGLNSERHSKLTMPVPVRSESRTPIYRCL